VTWCGEGQQRTAVPLMEVVRDSSAAKKTAGGNGV